MPAHASPAAKCAAGECATGLCELMSNNIPGVQTRRQDGKNPTGGPIDMLPSTVRKGRETFFRPSRQEGSWQP
jgi:hypothetical protein